MYEDSYLDSAFEDRFEFDSPEDDNWDDSYDSPEDDSMDGDFDSAMASAGHGTDEDYGYFGEHDLDFYADDYYGGDY